MGNQGTSSLEKLPPNLFMEEPATLKSSQLELDILACVTRPLPVPFLRIVRESIHRWKAEMVKLFPHKI